MWDLFQCYQPAFTRFQTGSTVFGETTGLLMLNGADLLSVMIAEGIDQDEWAITMRKVVVILCEYNAEQAQTPPKNQNGRS